MPSSWRRQRTCAGRLSLVRLTVGAPWVATTSCGTWCPGGPAMRRSWPSLNAWAAVAEMELAEVRAKNHAHARGNRIKSALRLLAGVLLLTGPAFPFLDAGAAIGVGG